MAFNWLKNAVTGPFRGIYGLLKGEPRTALGAFGDTAKPLGIALTATGVGAPIGLPMAAAGGAAQKLDDEGDRGLVDILQGGAEGAALAYGAGKVGDLARGAYGALSGTPGPIMPGTVGSAPAVDLSEAVATNTGRTVAGNILPKKAGEGMLSGITSYLKENPVVPLSLASTAGNVYAAQQEGAVADRWQRIKEEEMERQAKLAELQTLFNLVTGSMRRY